MLALSKRQAKDADRVAGIELLILWPASLGAEPDLKPDAEREANSHEWQHAEDLVRASCAANGLVPVHVRVARVWRPADLPEGGGQRCHLAVTIIGRRWVHASTKSRGRVAFAQ
jgi:hypothetical protein